MTAQKGHDLIISVPWPIRLFGDLQDDLGLPAVMMAGDLRTVIGATPRDDGLYHISTQGLAEPLTIDPRGDPAAARSIPSLRRTLEALQSRGMAFDRGFDFQAASRAPGGEALLDIRTMTTAWTVALLAVHGRLSELSGRDVVGIVCAAYEAESAPTASMCEIYPCVLGGTLFVEPGAPPKSWPVERELPGVVIGSTGARRLKAQRLIRAGDEVRAALTAMTALDARFDPATTPMDDVVARLGEVTERQAALIYAQLRTRDICREVQDLLDGEVGFDDDRVGEMLDDAHEMLRDYLGFNVPGIERLIAVARAAGAVGCKIVPPGNLFIAFAPGKENDVIEAIRKAKGRAYGAAATDGMRVEAQSGPR